MKFARRGDQSDQQLPVAPSIGMGGDSFRIGLAKSISAPKCPSAFWYWAISAATGPSVGGASLGGAGQRGQLSHGVGARGAGDLAAGEVGDPVGGGQRVATGAGEGRPRNLLGGDGEGDGGARVGDDVAHG